jgi:hypothetical protein
MATISLVVLSGSVLSLSGSALSRRWPAPPRHTPPRLQEPPFPLPYDVPKMPKPFSDYEWDPTFPGTFKPGMRGENHDLEDVLAMWEGRDNPACMELPQDQLWQVPLAPAEDILSWLGRIGLLEKDEDSAEEEESFNRGDSLLDEEFDLDEDALMAEGGDTGVDAM